MKLGINFGTSFSLPVTIYLDAGITLLPGGKYGIPSVFYFDEWEGVLVGEEAEAAGQGNEAKNLKREIKMELNSSFTADGRTFSARQIVGYILSHVKETAQNVARTKLINESLEGVVISVPAAFGHNEKEYIREAAEMLVSQGGPEFNVLGFVKEPVAAALAYFKAPLADQTRIMVYDLGGGTCDVAIVEADSSCSEKYTVIDSDMKRIGGKDWDSRLEAYIRRELEKQSGILRASRRVKLGIVLSAWDSMEESPVAPEEYAKRHLALVWQFLHTNKDCFEVSYWGVSIGGMAIEEKRKYQSMEHPYERIQVINNNQEITHDITSVLYKMLGEIDGYENKKIASNPARL